MYAVDEEVWIEVGRNSERMGKILSVLPFSNPREYVVITEANQTLSVCENKLRPLFRPTGEVRPLSQTGGTKHDTGKNRVDLIPPTAIEAMGEAFTFGASKYADHNWAKGFNYSRLIGAAMRHILAYSRGEDKDPESGLSHIAHAQACLAMLSAHEVERLGTDDRRKI